jgi:hypothetical protein
MSEANVETIRRHYEIRHGEGSKRRKVGSDDRSWEHPRPWVALARRCGRSPFRIIDGSSRARAERILPLMGG